MPTRLGRLMSAPDGRGFAGMDEEKKREIARMGGKAAHEHGNAHEFDHQEAVEAGRKGGRLVARDRAHMAEIGRKGGRASHANARAPASDGLSGDEV